MSNVLILGGTGWLSSIVARRWRAQGAAVTALARGSRPAPDDVHLVVSDRDSPDAYERVVDRSWDEVVDISSNPEHVVAALGALSDRAHHWTYVSSVSAYAASDAAGSDETATLAEPLHAGEPYDYSRAKSAAEGHVRAARDDRAAIVRPGLVVGPGDPTDRFGYWVSRFALAEAEPVLVPTAEGRFVQVIDVDDLADAIVHLGATGARGAVNAVGDPVSFEEFLAHARRLAGHTGSLVAAGDEWLTARNVGYWSGTRSLPLWLPGDMPGFATRTNAAYRAAGGRVRDLNATLGRTLEDERVRGLSRDRVAGLSRADELALLAELA